ncbi:hypothetical protein VE03_08480 [Pseudogymnoascus sp. 23342-1-I1]|nr:hypothetical protein VE03_08480 [Pseudogymnoascus sp. 23342-1-I1]
MPFPYTHIGSSDTTLSELSTESPTKLTKSDFEIHGIIIFIVDKEKHMLQMDRRTVCESSEWIDAECKDLPHTSAPIRHLPNTPVDIFTLFLVWLSTGDLNNAEHFASPRRSLSALNLEDASEKLSQLIQCYQLSKLLIARSFQNYIADQICNHLECLVDKDGLLENTIVRNIPLIYADYLQDSKLKCLFEDAIVTRSTNLMRWKVINTLKAEPMVSAFWNGVAVAAIRRTRELEAGRMRFPLNWGEEDRCKYHEHKNDDEVVDCRERRLEKPGRIGINQ